MACSRELPLQLGDVHRGGWKRDRAHGQGSRRYAASGDEYTGEWADGLVHGAGVLARVGVGAMVLGVGLGLALGFRARGRR